MRCERDRRLLSEGAGLIRLTDERVLAVDGDDARTWLMGVTTQDLRSPSPDVARCALFVDARGRVQAEATVLEREGGFDLLVASGVRDALVAELDRRIVMEDVELSAPEGTVWTVQGPRASRPAGGYSHNRLGAGGFDWWVPGASSEPPAIPEAQEVSGEAYELARITAGVPRFGRDFGGDHYPQEAGLGATHVSFDKGCYVGQEAVHMLEVRGKPPKRLALLELAAEPAVGAEVRAQGRAVGVVTSSADGEEGARALAMIRRAALEEELPLEVDGVSARVARLAGAFGT